MLHSSEPLFTDVIPEMCDVNNNTLNQSAEEVSFAPVPYSLSEEMNRIVPQLSVEKPFIHFDLGLSDADIEMLNTLQMSGISQRFNDDEAILSYDLHNVNMTTMHNNIKAYIESLAHENSSISEHVATLLARLILNVSGDIKSRSDIITRSWESYGGEANWGPGGLQNYNWHLDSCHPFNICTGSEYAVILTLKGPSTVFAELNNETREKFLAEYSKDGGSSISDSALEAKYGSLSQAHSIAAFGQGTVFSTTAAPSLKVFPAIHSAPLGNGNTTRLAVFAYLSST